MVNATEMAKLFEGKLVTDFPRLDQTKAFVAALVKDGNPHVLCELPAKVQEGV